MILMLMTGGRQAAPKDPSVGALHRSIPPPSVSGQIAFLKACCRSYRFPCAIYNLRFTGATVPR